MTFFIIIHLLPEFLPVLRPLTRWCASTLGTALLCSSRGGSDLGLMATSNFWLWMISAVLFGLQKIVTYFCDKFFASSRILTTRVESCDLWSKSSTPKPPWLVKLIGLMKEKQYNIVTIRAQFNNILICTNTFFLCA